MSLSLEQEARKLLEAEDKARLDAAVQAVAQRRERQREAAERAAVVGACKQQLAAIDPAPLEHLRTQAAAALDAYVAGMAAHNAQIAAIRDELQAVGSNLPADVDLYPQHGGLTIGDVVVRRQRLQTNVSNMARTVLRTHITRGNIDLERPGD